MSFLKYNVFKMKKPTIDENFFCEYVRTNEQEKLIKLIKQFNIKVSKLKINWDYMSQYDNLTVIFCMTFKKYINFANLSKNKYLTIEHIREFKDYLDWTNLSKNYKFLVPHLKEFEDYISWQSIFFYQNLPINTLKENFSNKMWWLFLTDKHDNFIDVEYSNINDLIINKSIIEVPLEFIDQYNQKLEEFQNNTKILKLSFKKELTEYVKLYDDKKIIRKLPSTKLTTLDKNDVIINLDEQINDLLKQKEEELMKQQKEDDQLYRKKVNEDKLRKKEKENFKDVQYISDYETESENETDDNDKEVEKETEKEGVTKTKKKRKGLRKKTEEYVEESD